MLGGESNHPVVLLIAIVRSMMIRTVNFRVWRPDPRKRSQYTRTTLQSGQSESLSGWYRRYHTWHCPISLSPGRVSKCRGANCLQCPLEALWNGCLGRSPGRSHRKVFLSRVYWLILKAWCSAIKNRVIVCSQLYQSDCPTLSGRKK